MSWSIESGYSHRCDCGSTWYDSDGGPCHYRCSCGDLVDIDEFTNGYCKKCIEKVYESNRAECDKDNCTECSEEQARYCSARAIEADMETGKRDD